MNPVTDAIARIAETIAALPADKVAVLETAATMDSEMWLAFGPIPTEKLAAGVISADTAQTLYAIHTTFKSESLAARMVYLMTMGELVAR